MTRVMSGVPRLSASVCVRVCGSSSHTPVRSSLGPQEPHRRRGWKAGEGGAARSPRLLSPPPPPPPHPHRILSEDRNQFPSETSHSTTKTKSAVGGARGRRGGVASVEEDGVRVPVGHLSHVLQDVLLGDDSQ